MDIDVKRTPSAPGSATPNQPGQPRPGGMEPKPTPSPLPDLSDDPFAPDEKPPVTPSGNHIVSKNHRKGGGKKALIVILILLLIGGAAAGAYFYQEQRVKSATTKTSELENQVSDLKTQLSDLQAAEEAAESVATEQANLTTDEAVLAAAKAACNAMVDSSNQPLVFTVGTVGAQNKQVVFSENKSFAQLRGTCGTAQNPGNAQTFYVKDTGNNTWFTVYHNTTAPDAATVQMYQIPTTFN